MYEEVTRDILIRVRPAFLEEESEPEEGRYVWAYTRLRTRAQRPCS